MVTESASKPSPRRRWPALLLILMLMAVGANLLYAALAPRKILLTGEAGDLLYAAAFDEFADEWDRYEGQQSAKIHENRLKLDISAAQTAGWSTARHHFGDFDITAQAAARAGPLDNAFGIIFRKQGADEGLCDLPAVVLCAIDRYLPLAGAAIRQIIEPASPASYYAFLISSDGYYSVWKTAHGRQQKLSAWIPSPQIKTGLRAENTIRVLGRGPQFQFFINEQPVMLCIPADPQALSTYANGECIEGTMQPALHDDSLAAGRLGVIARSMQAGGLTVQFDNIIVFSPADSQPNEESRA